MKVGFYCVIVLLFASCRGVDNLNLVDADNFKTTLCGSSVDLYNLESDSGLRMQVTNYGARVVSLWVKDKSGKYDDVVLGHDNIDSYVNAVEGRYFGAVVGRYANRIGNASFMIDTIKYQLSENNSSGSIHGGELGFDRVVWNVDSVSQNMISFSHISPDNDEGFPGELTLKIVYRLTADNEFVIEYEAQTSKTTHVNLSQHSFFNLKGEGSGTILDHLVTIYSDSIVEVDSRMLPTGDVVAVEGTPFDFRKPTCVGDRIDIDNEQLKFGSGYDHCWTLDNRVGVVKAATVYEPNSGRIMEVWTDQPGMQFYTSNNLHGANRGKSGKGYNFRESFAMETQKYPDTPNHPNFPSTLLNEGEIYAQTCIYKFSVQ